MKKSQIVAFDFGSKNIKIAMGSSKNECISLDKYEIIPTPEEAILDGKIYEKAKMVELLKQFVKENKIKKQKVMINISSGETILRTFDLPKMKEKELRGAVKFEIEHLLPEPVDNYVIDFTILDEYEQKTENKEKISMLKVQTATLPKRIVRTYLDTFKEAGLKIDVVDIHSNSVIKLFKGRKKIIKDFQDEEIIDKNIALIDLGNQKTIITIIEYGNIFLNRTISRGGKDITRIIAETLQISMQEAEKWKLNNDYFHEEGNEMVYATMKYYLEDFMLEINDIINYFISRSIQKKIDYIYLIGGGAKNTSIREYFENYMNVVTRLGNNYDNIQVKAIEQAFNEDLLYLWDVLGILLRKE